MLTTSIKQIKIFGVIAFLIGVYTLCASMVHSTFFGVVGLVFIIAGFESSGLHKKARSALLLASALFIFQVVYSITIIITSPQTVLTKDILRLQAFIPTILFSVFSLIFLKHPSVIGAFSQQQATVRTVWGTIVKFLLWLIILFLIFVGCFSISMMRGFVSPPEMYYNQPNDCPKGHLDEVGTCRGYSKEGFQNSGRYYMIAHGKPRQEFCADFKGNTQNLDSDVAIENCPKWTEGCPIFEGSKDWTCYACDNPSSNNNTHFYLLAAFSSDCQKGVFFSGSKYQPSQFAQELIAE